MASWGREGKREEGEEEEEEKGAAQVEEEEHRSFRKAARAAASWGREVGVTRGMQRKWVGAAARGGFGLGGMVPRFVYNVN